MSRRGENIRKRKDGRWEGRYSVQDMETDRRISHSVYARTYTEVKEKLIKAKMSVESAVREHTLDEELNFGRTAEEWLTVIKHSKKHATYVKYCSVYEKHIKKKLERLSFAQLNENILASVFQERESPLLSDSIQKSISCVLNQIFSYASLHYHVRVPRYTYQKQKKKNGNVDALNQFEQMKLLQYLYEEMDIYKLGIIICISTGLRLGEICALRWEDIDLQGGLLHVNKTVQRIAVAGNDTRTMLMEGEPKSIFSKREIPLSDEMIKLLFFYHGNAETYVINRNKPMEPRTYQNKFQKYLQMAGIHKRNFHSLRHTFATNCISSGTDIKSLSEILGHSDVKITLNRYVHPTMETKRHHMNSLSLIYGQYLGQEQI